MRVTSARMTPTSCTYSSVRPLPAWGGTSWSQVASPGRGKRMTGENMIVETKTVKWQKLVTLGVLVLAVLMMNAEKNHGKTTQCWQNERKQISRFCAAWVGKRRVAMSRKNKREVRWRIEKVSGTSVRITKALDAFMCPRKKVIGKTMENVMENLQEKSWKLAKILRESWKKVWGRLGNPIDPR